MFSTSAFQTANIVPSKQPSSQLRNIKIVISDLPMAPFNNIFTIMAVFFTTLDFTPLISATPLPAPAPQIYANSAPKDNSHSRGENIVPVSLNDLVEMDGPNDG